MLFPRAASDPISVGPYRLNELLGQGGMAVVYKAKRQGPAGFEKTVVVKLMLPGLIARGELVDLFRAEAKLSAQLAHPNIVQVHDFGVVDGVPFLVMEFLDGRNLTQLRAALESGRPSGALPLGAALAIARDMCHALGYAHDFVDPEGKRRQIIHRDVSPSNVMLCRDGTVKLLDFGVAKVAGQFDSEVTQSFRGKYAYMAPEQVNRQAIDRRVDVFAAGIVLHEMLTGRRLFAAPSELETLERVAQARVIAPSVDNADVPRKLDALVKKALSLNPNDRFSSGAEMAEAIEQLSGKAWTRRKLAAWLTQLFPADFTVTCEVCGKQVAPGEACAECGTRSPSQETEVAPVPVPSVPAIESDSGPLPLPPPPMSTSPSGRRLALVKAESGGPAAPVAIDGSEALDQMSLLSPAPKDSSFEPNSIDKTPVEGAPLYSEPQPVTRPTMVRDPGDAVTATPATLAAAFDSPSTTRSTTKPKLFVVRDDDSVKMGLHGVPEPSRPTVVATPQGQPARTTGTLPSVTRRQSTVPTRLMAQVETPDLRPRATGWKLAFALLIGGGVAALSTMIWLQSTPSPSPAVVSPSSLPTVQAPAPSAAPTPPPAPQAPIVQQAPVVVTPPAPPAASVKIAAPVVVAAPEPSKALHAAAPKTHRPARRHDATARPADPPAPKSTIREGRIVDPFAGGD
jgi:serine/threonine-protein kinase